MLLTALGLGLVMTTMTETMITANYRDGGEAMYAADAGVERVMQDLLTVPDWNRILHGAVQSSFVDGAPSGTRTLPDGSTTRPDGGDQHAELRQDDDVLVDGHERLDAGAAVRRRTTRAGSCSPTRR